VASVWRKLAALDDVALGRRAPSRRERFTLAMIIAFFSLAMLVMAIVLIVA
jgi:hypothetical protein